MKRIFVAWTRYNRRSDLLAQHFGAGMYHLEYGKRDNILIAPFRYMVLSARTWRILRRERPEIVFVQNPPIVTVLLTYIYARLYGARYVIDSHTAAFLSPKWKWALGLHRWLSRRAVTTIVTNNALRRVVESWGCRAFILGFTPAEYPEGTSFPLTTGFNVVVISTFSEDEPLDVVMEAARRLPTVTFYVTGDARRISPDLLAKIPSNCQLTGYLPYEQYVGLLREVDSVIDLTNRDHTLLLGAFEAVSLGTPLIVSDWPILREYFSLGTIHVPNTVEGVCEGVQRMRCEQTTLRHEMKVLREELHSEWELKHDELESVLGGAA